MIIKEIKESSEQDVNRRAKHLRSIFDLGELIWDSNVYYEWCDYIEDQFTKDFWNDMNYYIYKIAGDDELFGEILTRFLNLMITAKETGGLYCNYVKSND